MEKQEAEKIAYNALLSSQLIHVPEVDGTQDMPEATHTQPPLCEQLLVTIHHNADLFGAANGLQPFVGGGLIAVGNGDEVDGRVGGGCRTEG